MFDGIDNNAFKSLMLAIQEARRLGHSHVGTQHFLLGMLGDRNGPAAKLLKEAGVNITETRSKVEENSERGPESVPVLPFTARAERVLERAREAARKLDGIVDTQHILIGIIDEGSCKGFDLLTQFGVNLLTLRENANHTRREAATRVCKRSKHPPLSKDDRAKFFDVFLSEIVKIMNYPMMGLKDSLFLTVNILGNALKVSRGLIVLEHPVSGRQFFEYWQKERVRSVNELDWPQDTSPLIAQTLMAEQPLILVEGDNDSRVLSMQDELRLLQAKSYYGVQLQGRQKFLGCIMLHQCDRPRNWIEEDDVSWIQNVASEIAGILVARSDEIGK